MYKFEKSIILELGVENYCSFLEKYSNCPLSIKLMSMPFRLFFNDDKESADFLVGHLLESVCSRYDLSDKVGPLDVAGCAWDIDFSPAYYFLKYAPNLIYKKLYEGRLRV